MNLDSLFNFLTDTSTTARRVLLTLLMLLGWLLSIILGVWAIVVLSDWVVHLLVVSVKPGDSVVQRSGMAVTARYTVFILGGIGWIVLTIAGFERVKYLTKKRSWQLTLWTLLIEGAIILSGVIFLGG